MAERSLCKHCFHIHGSWEPHVWSGTAFTDEKLPPRGPQEKPLLGPPVEYGGSEYWTGPTGENLSVAQENRCCWCGAIRSARATFCSDACRQANHRFERTYQSLYPDSEPPPLRKRVLIFERDEWRCQYCGRSPGGGVVLEVDHVIPRSAGGSDAMDNLVTACAACNSGKGDAILTSFPWRVERKGLHEKSG